MNNKKSSGFGFGLIIGAAIGSVAGLLLSPKSGKENRKMAYKQMRNIKAMIDSGELQERVYEVFGNIQDESMRLYTNTRDEVMKGFERAKEMSYDDYVDLVQRVINNAKHTASVSAEQLQKMKDSFMQEWEEAQKEDEKPHSKPRKLAKSEEKFN